MSTIFTPTPQPDLAWNADGQVACKKHQPYGSTWGLDGWEPVTDEDQKTAREELGRKLSCEHCR